MDAALLLGLFIVLAAAAARWGHDSREGVRSKEQDLAASGIAWPDRADPRGREHAGSMRHSVAESTTVRNRVRRVPAADERETDVGCLVTLGGPGKSRRNDGLARRPRVPRGG
jgi:hypothetical protein